ncbi:MAG: hypothetical protein KGN36_07550, partial [Acidobacteriota bacterium]|nr:hypothetical protein [Acidobacteriota bacterium]
MFFRRERPRVPAFQERLDALKSAGFTVAPQSGGARVSRGECAVDLTEASGGGYRIDERAGILSGGEIASLVDGGFQKFFRTPSGTRRPAIADQLKA